MSDTHVLRLFSSKNTAILPRKSRPYIHVPKLYANHEPRSPSTWGSQYKTPCSIPPASSPLPVSMSHESRTLLCRTSLTRPWILCCLVAAVTMVCFSITIGWRLGVSDLEGSSPRPSAARSVLFTLDVVALDPLQNIVTLDWRILADDCVAGPIPSAECPVVNIYVNPCVFLI